MFLIDLGIFRRLFGRRLNDIIYQVTVAVNKLQVASKSGV